MRFLSRIRRWGHLTWRTAKTPSAHIPLGLLVAGGFGWGILFWGGLHTGIRVTNSNDFCVSCHSMRENVYQEYQRSVHYINSSGVRASCSDCHVPHDWADMIERKVKASREVWATIIGTVNTPQKFEERRLELAKHVWRRMQQDDSDTCRTCHNSMAMDLIAQNQRAERVHSEFLFTGKNTCIDCHKGIAHSLPDMSEIDPAWTVAAELRGK